MNPTALLIVFLAIHSCLLHCSFSEFVAGNINIRSANPSDAIQLRELIQELADHHGMSGAPKIGAEQLAADLAAGKMHSIVAMDGEVLAAYAIYYLPSSSEQGQFLHTEDVCVRQAYRRYKLGVRLMHELQKVMRQRNLPYAEGEVARSNAGAIAFYSTFPGMENMTDDENKMAEQRKILWRLPSEAFERVLHAAGQNPLNFWVILDDEGKIGKKLAQKFARKWQQMIAVNDKKSSKNVVEKRLSTNALATEMEKGQLGVMTVMQNANNAAGMSAMALFHGKAYSSWKGAFVVLDKIVVANPQWCEPIVTAIVAELVKLAAAMNAVRIQWMAPQQPYAPNQCQDAIFYKTLNAINLTEKEGWMIYRFHNQQYVQPNAKTSSSSSPSKFLEFIHRKFGNSRGSTSKLITSKL